MLDKVIQTSEAVDDVLIVTNQMEGRRALFAVVSFVCFSFRLSTNTVTLTRALLQERRITDFALL